MRPTPRLLKVLGAMTLLALAVAISKWVAAGKHSVLPFMGTAENIWWGLFVTLILVCLLDIHLTRRAPRILITRSHSDNVALGRDYPVQLMLEHRYKRPMPIVIYDHHPLTCDTVAKSTPVTLLPGQKAQVSYEITPQLRGEQVFGKTDVLVPGPLGLWHQRWSLGEVTRLRVYPNFELLAKLSMITTQQNRTQLGIRQQYRRGEGMEFHQLREFRQGDSLRQIDWKASSRKHKLISKEYQDEKDQQIIFMLDCSRRMRSIDGELSFFDHALHAMLILSQVALREGDAVGILSFGAGYRWQKPLKSSGAINTLLNHVYDIYPTSQAPDYADATRQLLLRHTKRALIVLLTNVDQADIKELRPAIRAMQAKHLVMVANLQEPILDVLLREDVEGFRDALRYCGASELNLQQQEMTRKLQQSGVIAINTIPENLPHNLVTHYLDVKRSHRL